MEPEGSLPYSQEPATSPYQKTSIFKQKLLTGLFFPILCRLLPGPQTRQQWTNVWNSLCDASRVQGRAANR
jgi:hypothetical protein